LVEIDDDPDSTILKKPRGPKDLQANMVSPDMFEKRMDVHAGKLMSYG
jgi:hypothetical protein